MIKKIMFITFSFVIGAERDSLPEGFMPNPAFAVGGVPLLMDGAWEDLSLEDEPQKSRLQPTPLITSFRGLFEWGGDIRRPEVRKIMAEEYLRRINMAIIADPTKFSEYKKRPENKEIVVFGSICDSASFIRSISQLIGGMVKPCPEKVPSFVQRVTFIQGAKTIHTPLDQHVFRSLPARGSNDGFLSVVNAITLVSLFQGDVPRAQMLQGFLKGVTELGQGTLCHNAILEKADSIGEIMAQAKSGNMQAQADLETYKKDKRVAYPTNMNSEAVVNFLVEMGARRLYNISMGSFRSAYNKTSSRWDISDHQRLVNDAKSFVLRAFRPVKPGDMAAAAYIVEENMQKNEKTDVNFFALIYAYYHHKDNEKSKIVGTIVDPRVFNSEYRIEGAQEILAEVADQLLPKS